MQPSPEGNVHEPWGRLSLWLNNHQPFARLGILTTGLVAFFAFLPAYLRMVFWDGLLANKILTGMLLVFSLLSISLIWSAGQKLDTWAFLFFNVWRPRPIWLDRIMSGFTQIGNIITTLIIALVLFLVSQRTLAYELILGTLTLWLVVELVKFFVHRSRPFIRLTQARIVGYRARGRSFPSGHTSQTFFIATLMVQHFHAGVWVALLLYTVALLVGITRMYVGAHYPRDVMAGAILGSAWGLLGVMVDAYVF
jgi:membrane-associated phospholipid phosphatase